MSVPFIAIDDIVSGDTFRLTLFVDSQVTDLWDVASVFAGDVDVSASVSVPEPGKIMVELSPAQTAQLGDIGTWDAQVTSPDADVFTVARGNFKVLQGVTPT